MKGTFEGYDAYKDSGVDWINVAPSHWPKLRLKDIIAKLESGVSVNASDEPVEGDNIGVLKTSCVGKGTFLPDQNKSVWSTEIERVCVPVRAGRIIISRMNTPELVGASAYLPKDYSNLFLPDRLWQTVFLANVKLDSEWLGLLMSCSAFRFLLSILATGTSPSMKNLGQEKLLSINLPFPSLSEQKAIADYLYTKTALIDRKIYLLTQKATQYGKLKQSLINETVTRGLDKSLAMKDSGVDWLGDVPKHWRVNRLKNLAYIKTGGKDTIDNVEDGAYPFFVRSQTIERINSYSFDGEAILTAGDGVGVGKVFHYVNCKFDYHQRVYKISNFRGVVGKFVFYYMRENFHKDALRLNAKSTVDSLRMPMFQNFTIAFGDLEEQQVIVDYLDTKTAQIDRIVETINTQIDKLKELRKTLINDVVTGKIKVA